jgi:hypothetical protein
MVNAIQHYPVPSIAKAAGNALNMRSAQIQMQGAEMQNALTQKKLGSYDEDREYQKKLQHFQTEAQALTAAFKSGNPDQAKKIYLNLGGNPVASMDFEGDDVSIDYGESTVKGTRKHVTELFEKIGEDPAWAKDPKTWAWAAARGISVERKEAKETPDQKLERQKELETHKAGLKGNQEKEKFGWVEQSDGSKVWSKLEPGTTSASDNTEKPMTKIQANKEITSIEGKIHQVKTKSGLMDMIMDNPEFASDFKKLFGDPESSQAKERYLNHLESRLDELYEVVGKKRETAKTDAPGMDAELMAKYQKKYPNKTKEEIQAAYDKAKGKK